MASLRRVAPVAVLAVLAVLAVGCYSPNIEECTIFCGAEGACPDDTTCMGDGFCHADIAVSCSPLGSDGGQLDARGDARPPDARSDARPVDARPGDARPVDARPDASTPPDGGVTCTNELLAVESTDAEDSIISNLSVEPDGHVHITYYESFTATLRYAHRPPGGVWDFEEVGDATNNLKGQTIDATGALHVAFTDRPLLSSRLRYARRSPLGTWTLETVDDGALGVDATIAVDGNQRVHLAWWYDLSELVYATRVGTPGGFVVETIDDDGTVGEHPSIAISPVNGALHVSYRIAGTRNDLGLATLKNNQSSWSLARPDTAGNVGSYTSLAVDATGGVHIAYSDFTSEQLKYAYLPVSGPNVIVPVEPGVGVGRFNSLALDRQGGVHITTYAYGDQNLRYAVKRAGTSSFVARTLDAAGNVGRHSSIGIDGRNIAHISYIDDTNGDLKYAKICP